MDGFILLGNGMFISFSILWAFAIKYSSSIQIALISGGLCGIGIGIGLCLTYVGVIRDNINMA